MYLIRLFNWKCNTSLIIGRFYGTDVRRWEWKCWYDKYIKDPRETSSLAGHNRDLLKGVLACAAGYFVIMNISTYKTYMSKEHL